MDRGKWAATFREMREMRLDEAVEATLTGLGSIVPGETQTMSSGSRARLGT